jgi:hypothetical protein
MKRTLLTAIAAVGAFSLFGCGGGGSTVIGTSENPRVRVYNALTTPDDVDVRVNNELVADDAAFADYSDYKIINNGNRRVEFLDSTTNGSLIDESKLFELDNYYTVVGYNDGDNRRLLVLSDRRDSSSDQGRIRFVKVAQGVGPVDVYITEPGASIVGAEPTISGVEIGNADQPYLAFAPGQYQIRVTAENSSVPLISENVTVTAGRNITVLADGTTDLKVLVDREDD